jgi:hypothetical protein
MNLQVFRLFAYDCDIWLQHTHARGISWGDRRGGGGAGVDSVGSG